MSDRSWRARTVFYSISAGQTYDGKSVCLWRTQGSQAQKIARFQNKQAARLFAAEFSFPLSDEIAAALEDSDE